MRATLALMRERSSGLRLRRPPLPYLLVPALLLLRLPFRSDPVVAMVSFNLVFLIIAGLGIGYAARAAWHPRLSPAARRPWRPLVLSNILLVPGVSAVAVALGLDPTMAKVSPPLVFGVATRVVMLLLLTVALVRFAAARLDRRGRVKLVLDMLTVMGGAFIPLWYVLIGPVVTGGEHHASPALTLYSVTFGLCDLGSIVAISAVLLRGPARAVRRPLVLWLIASAGFLASDLWFIGMQISGQPYIPTVATDLALLVPGFVMVCAAVERCRNAGVSAAAELPAAATRIRPPSSLPYVAVGVGYVVLLAASADSGLYPWRGLVVASLCMTVGVAARQLIALRENFTLVRTDALTGIANRIQFRAALDRALAVGTRNDRTTAVLAIDFNGFKQVNDTHGHEAGDTLLQAFAGVLRSSVRTVDTPARIGGDEFVVVLDGVSGAEAAVSVAEQILAATRATPVLVAGHTLTMSVSIGVAVAAADSTADDLVRHADRAMYLAKRDRALGWRLYADAAEVADAADAAVPAKVAVPIA